MDDSHFSNHKCVTWRPSVPSNERNDVNSKEIFVCCQLNPRALAVLKPKATRSRKLRSIAMFTWIGARLERSHFSRPYIYPPEHDFFCELLVETSLNKKAPDTQSPMAGPLKFRSPIPNTIKPATARIRVTTIRARRSITSRSSHRVQWVLSLLRERRALKTKKFGIAHQVGRQGFGLLSNWILNKWLGDSLELSEVISSTHAQLLFILTP